MTITYNLAPNPKWMAWDERGEPLIGGKLYTSKSGTTHPKATYADKDGRVENANPVILDAKGQATIYWASDEAYTLELYDRDGELVFTQDNYNAALQQENKTTVVSKTPQNFCSNPQFNEWSTGAFIDLSAITEGPIMDGWCFQKTNTYSKDFVKRQAFALGQTEVPANPIFYAEFSCTDLGNHGELYKGIRQNFQGVQTFVNSEVTVSFYAKSSHPLPVELQVIQDFGSGKRASPLTRTPIKTFVLSNTWTRCITTFTVPSITGKAIGTQEDDTFGLWIGFPINTVYDALAISNVQLELGNVATDFEYQLLRREKDARMQFLQLFPTGWLQPIYSDVLPAGWIWANDGTIGNANSKASNRAHADTKALYSYLWNLHDDPLCLVSGGRGVSAETDFNANKPIDLPKLMGRCLMTSGQGKNLTARKSTEFGGTENHTLTLAELPPHHHTASAPSVNYYGVAPGGNWQSASHQPMPTSNAAEHGLKGNPHPIMQPWSAVPMMIKL